jgi:PAS domain S-box-containing protein
MPLVIAATASSAPAARARSFFMPSTVLGSVERRRLSTRATIASRQTARYDLLVPGVSIDLRRVASGAGSLSDDLMPKEPRIAGPSVSHVLSVPDAPHFRRIVEQARVGIWTLDESGRTTFANDRIAAMVGHAAPELIGRQFTDLVGPNSRDWAQSSLDASKRGVAEQGGVCDLVARDGRAIRARCDLSPLQDDAGQIAGTLIVVTPADEGDTSLRHLASLVQNIGDFVGMCDLQFRPFFVNRAGAQAIALANRPDATVFDFFFEEDHEFLRSEFFPKVLSEGNAAVDIRFRHFTTGEPVWMHYHVVRLDDADGKPSGYATISQDLSERKRSEDLLMQIAAEKEESLRRFRELADSMPQIVWSATADGVVDYRNRRWYELTGTTSPAGVDLFGFLHRDDLEPVTQAWRTCLETGTPLEIELRLKFPTEAEHRWYVARANPVRDAAGAIVKWYGTHTDIHDWKVAEASLIESRERLRVALDASATGTFRWDIQTNRLEWDENLDRLFGLAAGESARSFDEFVARVHHDDRAEVVARCELCAREGVDFAMEFRVVWPDGTVRWLADRGRSYLDARGRLAYMTGACVDVTDRKVAEERLARKRRILEMIARGRPLASTLQAIVALLESQWPDAVPSVMLVDDAGRMHVGAATRLPAEYAASLEGLPIGPAVGSCGTAAYRGEPVLVPDITQDPLWADYHHLAAPFGLRACWSVPIIASTGRVVGTIAVYYHEPRLPHSMETELAMDAATSLAAIAIERSLIEEALHEHARALVSANQNKDQFLARLAHELRNPLGAIQTALEIFKLMLDQASPLQRPRAVIDRQTRHMIRLIDELSDLSRIGTGKMEIQREPVELGAIATDAAETIRPLAAARHQRLELHLPPAPIIVTGDSARLNQVCVNLLNNAVKYTQVGGAIDLSVDSQGGTARIAVRDNGMGIPGDMLTKVFDLYTQAESVGEHAQGGVGIGLHLVQSLVRLHGGTVTARSEGPGRGTEFIVSLPLDSSGS